MIYDTCELLYRSELTRIPGLFLCCVAVLRAIVVLAGSPNAYTLTTNASQFAQSKQIHDKSSWEAHPA